MDTKEPVLLSLTLKNSKSNFEIIDETKTIFCSVWVLSLTCGNSESGIEHNTMYSLFNINMALTDDGFKNIDKVLEAVFSYIELVRSVGPQERIFKEIQSIAETSFRFETDRTAADIVEDLSSAMHFYPPEHYLCGSELLMDYDPEVISLIVPNCNANVPKPVREKLLVTFTIYRV